MSIKHKTATQGLEGPRRRITGATSVIRTYLLDHRKDPGLAIIVPVCTHSEVDLLGEGIRFVGCGQLEDAFTQLLKPGLRIYERAEQTNLSGGARGTLDHVSRQTKKNGGELNAQSPLAHKLPPQWVDRNVPTDIVESTPGLLVK